MIRQAFSCLTCNSAENSLETSVTLVLLLLWYFCYSGITVTLVVLYNRRQERRAS